MEGGRRVIHTLTKGRRWGRDGDENGTIKQDADGMALSLSPVKYVFRNRVFKLKFPVLCNHFYTQTYSV